MKALQPICGVVVSLLIWTALGTVTGPALAGEVEDETMGLSQLVQYGDQSRPPEPDTEARERVTIITGEWVDVREILQFVAKSNGYGLQIAPDVEGQANVHLENVPLGKALKAILEPIDLGYELVDGNLLVFKHGMVTRWFNFDYMVTTREGRGELRVSGRGESRGGNLGGSGSDENESQLSSSIDMTIWPEVTGALEVILFRGNTPETTGEQEGNKAAVNLADEHGRSLIVSPMAGLIQATAEWNRLQQIETYLGRLQSSLRRQVAIEVKILEVTLSDEHTSGIDWNSFYSNGGQSGSAALQTSAGLTNPFFRFVVDGKSIRGVMDMVESQGDVRVVNTPRITTLNNQKAVVRIVTEEVFYEAQVEPAVVTTTGGSTDPVVIYQASIIPIGLVLDVTPQVGFDGVVTLNVHPTITDIVRVESSPNQDTAPVVSVRELDTVGKVRDGETLVIAGLMATGNKSEQSGVPILGRIPLLGYLFRHTVKSKTRTELVMLLTPVILNQERIDAWAEKAVKSIDG